ncbi:MAG: hypothetical protein KC470_13275, partial [Dehalococcoidia bacterium]|nr:hypothetical protein [Dehalococcoidia bacterium]
SARVARARLVMIPGPARMGRLRASRTKGDALSPNSHRTATTGSGAREANSPPGQETSGGTLGSGR